MANKVFDIPFIDVLHIQDAAMPLALGERRKHQILESAFEVLKGYDGTSMQDIADAAKVKRTLVHQYFNDKK